jgi:hypothetical protein
MADEVELKVTSIEVRAAQPKAADSRKVRHLADAGARAAEDVVYIVKLYMDDVEPLSTSRGYRLYVGDVEVGKYAAFKNGLYFKVHAPAFLTENAGEDVRFTADGLEFIDTGIRLPDVSADVGAAPSAPGAPPLPTQEEVLSD